jgi:hypothetical protein
MDVNSIRLYNQLVKTERHLSILCLDMRSGSPEGDRPWRDAFLVGWMFADAEKQYKK